MPGFFMAFRLHAGKSSFSKSGEGLFPSGITSAISPIFNPLQPDDCDHHSTLSPNLNCILFSLRYSQLPQRPRSPRPRRGSLFQGLYAPPRSVDGNGAFALVHVDSLRLAACSRRARSTISRRAATASGMVISTTDIPPGPCRSRRRWPGPAWVLACPRAGGLDRGGFGDHGRIGSLGADPGRIPWR